MVGLFVAYLGLTGSSLTRGEKSGPETPSEPWKHSWEGFISDDEGSAESMGCRFCQFTTLKKGEGIVLSRRGD